MGNMGRNGFSIIEVLVGAGIASIVSLAISSMVVSQNKQSAALENKLDRSDTRNFLLQTLLQPGTCLWQIATNTVNLSQAISPTSMSPVKINLTALYGGPTNASPKVVEVGKRIGSTGRSPQVDSISFQNLYKISDDVYHGDFVVSFEQGAVGTTPLAPIVVGAVISTDSSTPVSAKQITACGSDVTAAPVSEGGDLCGLATYDTGASSRGVPSLSVISNCRGKFPRPVPGRVYGSFTWSNDCPSGYTIKTVQMSSDTRPTAGSTRTGPGTATTTFYLAMCVKQ
jgi:type II secretory pathway pseudopilin PulG